MKKQKNIHQPLTNKESAKSVSEVTDQSKSYGSCCLDRREFIRITALGTTAATLSFTPEIFSGQKITYENWDPYKPFKIPGKQLRVQPVFMYNIPERREQTSWRPWGSIYTEEKAVEEIQRINRELSDMTASSDFPLKFLPVIKIQTVDQAKKIHNNDYDVVLLFAAGGSGELFQACTTDKKDNIIFVRHQSGPLYQWYQVLGTRFLKTDEPKTKSDNSVSTHVHVEDVVVDDYSELLWRLRALYGVKNFIGTKIVALGGAWGKYSPEAPGMARDLFKMDIIDVTYDSVETRIVNALADKELIRKAEKLTDKYLTLPNTNLKTNRKFVVNAFLLYFLFKNLMQENGASAFTLRNCMRTIIPVSKTTACLSLSLLMDEGYLAFCESDFVIIPPAVLLGHISGKPAFFHNSTFPHKAMVHCAHCAAPRRMDGNNYDPADILPHFESDYGAAPKVTLPTGQEVTFLNPEYSTGRWLGYKGNIRENPFFDSCTSQQIVEIQGNWKKLKNEARDSHWVMAYGDYLKEGEYAARRIGVNWEDLL